MFNIRTIGIKLDWTRSKVRKYLEAWAGKLDKFKILDKDDKFSEVILTDTQYELFCNWLKSIKKFKFSTNFQYGFDASSMWLLSLRHNHLVRGTHKTHNFMKKYGNDWLFVLAELDEDSIDQIMDEIFYRGMTTSTTIRKKITQAQKKFSNDRSYTNKKRRKK